MANQLILMKNISIIKSNKKLSTKENQIKKV